MGNRLRIFSLAIFILSVLLINFWSHFKLNRKYPDSWINKTQQAISRNCMIDEYAFFSPEIPDSYFVGFMTTNSTGTVSAEPFFYYSKEMENNVFSALHKFYSYPAIRDYLAYSLSAYYFSQHREKDRLVFFFSLYKLPDIPQYLQGVKPHYELVYAREYYDK
ncbi:MAG TPA: hypothetical protein VGM30_17555 [Puia sp.]|jgi:hypothetical protein